MNPGGSEAAITPARLRLYVHADLAAGATVTLTAAQRHYLRNVMRTDAGTPLRLFNGRDGEWLASGLDRGGDGVCVLRRLRPQRPEPGPLLLFAPLKKDNTDFVTVKATELGIAALLPVFTRHTATGRVNERRLALQAMEAAEQCGRLTVPAVAAAQPLDRALASWDGERTLFVAHPAPSGRPASAAFAGPPAGAGPPPGFLVGPEGGLANDELDRLAALPFVTVVTLGPRILRAETAAIAVLVCWQALAGDWNALGHPACATEE